MQEAFKTIILGHRKNLQPPRSMERARKLKPKEIEGSSGVFYSTSRGQQVCSNHLYKYGPSGIKGVEPIIGAVSSWTSYLCYGGRFEVDCNLDYGAGTWKLPRLLPSRTWLFNDQGFIITIDGNLNGYVKGIEIVWLEIGNEKVIFFKSHQGLEAGY